MFNKCNKFDEKFGKIMFALSCTGMKTSSPVLEYS